MRKLVVQSCGGMLGAILLLGSLFPSMGLAAPLGAGVEDPAEKAADLARARQNGDLSPDRLVVVYAQGAREANHPSRVNVRQQAGARLLRADTDIAQDVLRVPNGNASGVAQRIRSLPDVMDAYADPVASIDLTVNDPLFGSEWGLPKIQAPTAWDTSQGSGVKVAVLDCGIHASHPDLGSKVVLAQNFTTSTTTDDRCNHGTHVAGTIGAVTNNGIGVAAVAPQASLINGKVLNDTGHGFFSDIDTAIQWAADNGAKVINMSVGGTIACPSGTQTAANYAWNKGVVLAAAAGNGGTAGADAPANCQNVIGVAATDSSDAKASFSNFGSEVDVAAPGVNIWSTVNPDINGGTLYRGDFSGTSMATPHVSGVLALIWATSYGTNPTAVRSRLFSTADHIAGTGTYWSQGRINAAAAVAGGSGTSFTLDVTRKGGGSGTITSSPAGISCGTDCTESYASGTVVALTATPAAGSTFTGWGGACAGTAPSSPCSVSMTTNQSVTATFKLTADLSITKVGPPTGAVGVAYVYTLTVRNLGPNTSSKATMTDTLPLSLTAGAVATTTGTCGKTTTSTGATKVTCDLGALASGATATITIAVTPTAAGTIKNTARVSEASAVVDPSTTNNKSTATTTVS